MITSQQQKLQRQSVLLSRRRWLLGTSAATTAMLLAKPSSCLAIDPPVRPAAGPLKLSLAGYSFRQSLTRPSDHPEAMNLFDVVDYCRKHHVPGVELTSYYFPPEPSDDYLLQLARHCHLQGVSISAGAIRNDFCVGPEKIDAELDAVRRWIDIYAKLGAPAIRIFAGSPPPDVSREEAIARCIAACEQACEYAGRQGIFLALENHHGITDTAASMLQVVRGVKSPWFGVNFDSGNFRDATDPYSELAEIAPYAINAQVKVEIWQEGQKVAADLSRIVELLKQAGYGGWIALEYEAAEPAREAIPAYLEQLRELLNPTTVATTPAEE